MSCNKDKSISSVFPTWEGVLPFPHPTASSSCCLSCTGSDPLQECSLASQKTDVKRKKKGRWIFFFLQGQWIELAYRGVWWTPGLGWRLNHLARTRNCTARTGEEKGEQRSWEVLYLFSEQNIFDQFNWPEQLFVSGLNYFCLLSLIL